MPHAVTRVHSRAARGRTLAVSVHPFMKRIPRSRWPGDSKPESGGSLSGCGMAYPASGQLDRGAARYRGVPLRAELVRNLHSTGTDTSTNGSGRAAMRWVLQDGRVGLR